MTKYSYQNYIAAIESEKKAFYRATEKGDFDAAVTAYDNARRCAANMRREGYLAPEISW